MEPIQMTVIILCLIASPLLFLIPIALYFVRMMLRKTYVGSSKSSFGSLVKSWIMSVNLTILFYGCVFLSVWVLRYAVGYYSLNFPNPCEVPLTWLEEIANSFVHALQTFSMDEDYTAYITIGREMLQKIASSNSIWQYIYGGYASVLNIVAPVAGGAIVLELLSGFFPKFRLMCSFVKIWRKKYYFSKLNQSSLALANDIKIKENKKNPVFVFADTYTDDESEKDHELLHEAKRLGAICVREDLAHIKKPVRSKCEYHLIDEDEFCNLRHLTELAEERNFKYIKKTTIYLYVQSDAYVQIEKNVCIGIKEKLNDKERPIIVPVKAYRNLVHNLLVDVPLYEPLVGKKNPKSLNVTILGNGVIGTEAFFSVYWLGQMLVSSDNDGIKDMAECELTINVVSQDTEEVFWSKIDYVNPEIRETVEVIGSDKRESSGRLLAYNENGQKNSPYCKVSYIQSNVKTGDFWDDVLERKNGILNSDYFIVALGNDADNISVADKLRCCAGKKHFEVGDESDASKTVIAYAVFDSLISSTLNEQKCFKSKSGGVCDIYMHAFGSAEDVYSCDNVYMSKNKLWASQTGKAYLNAFLNDSHGVDIKKRIINDDYENSNYNYWANLARAMHVKYKVFSLGWIKSSVFDCMTDEELETHRENIKSQCEMYRTLATVYKPSIFVGEYKQKHEDIELKKHCLAWLEHRRWCAFTRTMGYQYMDIRNMLEQSGNHKDMRLKLHACLAEARMPEISGNNTYILARFDESGALDKNTLMRYGDDDEKDLLDIASFVKKSGDFKEYDYYRYELDSFEFESKILDELKAANVPSPESYCDHACFGDAICCETDVGKVYLVPVDEVKAALGRKYKTVAEDADIKGKFGFRKTFYATRANIALAAITEFFKKSKKE